MLLPAGSFAVISGLALFGLTTDKRPEGPAPRWDSRFSGYLTIAAIAVAFILSLWALDSAFDNDGARVGFNSHEWLNVPPLRVNIGITLDGLSAIMLVVVTGVSLLVQIYSQAYMEGDRGYNRYYAF